MSTGVSQLNPNGTFKSRILLSGPPKANVTDIYLQGQDT
jgi:hypothetical protein